MTERGEPVAGSGGSEVARALPRLRVLAVLVPCLAMLVLTLLRHTLVADRWPEHGHLLLDVILVLATAVFAVAMVASIEARHRALAQRARDLTAVEAVSAAARPAHTPDDVAHACLRAVVEATGVHAGRLDALDRLDPRSDTTTWQWEKHPAPESAPRRTLPLTCGGDPLGTLTLLGEDDSSPLTGAAHTQIAAVVAAALHRARHLAHLHHECHDAALAERDRIAREMHDSLAQALGAAHLRLHAIGAHPDVSGSAEVADELGDVAALCEEAYADVREAILGLRTTGGPERTLTQALEGYVAAWSRRCGIPATMHVETDAADALPPHDQNHVLRIVQEALTNARKHADPHGVDLRITEGEGRVRLTVTDDGRGFDPADPDEDRYGLATMTERALLLDGVLTLDTAPGHGTRVTLDVPAPARTDRVPDPSATPATTPTTAWPHPTTPESADTPMPTPATPLPARA